MKVNCNLANLITRMFHCRANANARMKAGATAMYVAAQEGQLLCMQVLLAVRHWL
jgi:hypothetical protein